MSHVSDSWLRLKIQGARYKVTGIKLNDLFPSPLREKVRMRGLLKAEALIDFILLSPTLSSRRGSFLL